MPKALYRKYRPTKLSEVIGQPQITDVLAKSLEQGKLSHAYLFVGPRGTGKTSVARIFAHEVNGFNYQIEDDYVDIIEIDGASNRGIDDVRDLREKATIAPTMGKYKIYIIDEVHMFTKDAFNALLKTLEEPPEHVIFIMATTDADKVPVTITSRAQTYAFKLADKSTMFSHLKSICDREKIQIEDTALNIIVARGGGSFRDSISLLDQISTLSGDKITEDMVISAMGLPKDEELNKLLEAHRSGDISKIGNQLKSLLLSGIKPSIIIEDLIAKIIEGPTPASLPLLAKLSEIDTRAPFLEARILVALTMNVVPQAQPLPSAAPLIQKQLIANAGRQISEETPAQPTTTAGIHPDTPTPQSTSTSVASSAFDWSTFVATIRSLNDAIFSQVEKCQHEFIGGELHLYPSKKIIYTILARDNNKKILHQAAGDIKITIHEYGDEPKTLTKDPLLSKISDIMGGEVNNDGGNDPF